MAIGFAIMENWWNARNHILAYSSAAYTYMCVLAYSRVARAYTSYLYLVTTIYTI